MSKFFFACIFCFINFLSLPSFSASLDDLDDIIQIDALAGWREGARHIMAFHFDLKEGWKTYWRHPGEVGVPPRIIVQGRDVRDTEIIWPMPSVTTSYGLRVIGYEGNFYLPVIVETGRPRDDIKVQIDIDIGVCREVCIPMRRELNLTLPAQDVPIAQIEPLLKQGIARANEKARCEIVPTSVGGALSAELEAPSFSEQAIAVIELNDENIWVGPTSLIRKAERLILQSELENLSDGPLLFSRNGVRFTLFEGDKALEIMGCS